jgi:hypothetical protein
MDAQREGCPLSIYTLGEARWIPVRERRPATPRARRAAPLLGPGFRLEPYLLVAAVAEGLVLGAAAATEGENLSRQLELVALGVLENYRALDAVRAVQTDFDPNLFQGDSSFDITREISSYDDIRRRRRNLRGDETGDVR